MDAIWASPVIFGHLRCARHWLSFALQSLGLCPSLLYVSSLTINDSRHEVLTLGKAK
jgi:hypothetical protein